MKPDTNSFDELIRQRITNLPTGPSRGWDSLERKLDVPDATDTAIAAKLAALPTATAPAGSWEALSGTLSDLEENAAAAVDTAVAGGLHQSSPEIVSGWALLASRLELIGKRREMVACMKISEAALLLSLVLLFFRFGNLPQDSRKPQVDLTPSAVGFPIAADLPEQSLPAPADDAEATRPVAPAKPARTLRPVSTLAITPVLPLSRAQALTIPALRRPNAPSGADQLATVDFGINVLPREVHPPLLLPSLLGGAPIRSYLNLFVSPVDLNQVVTQENESLGISAGSNVSTGYSIGALVDITQEKNVLETGLIYGYRSYVPAEILRLQNLGAQEDDDPVQYGQLSYHTVSLPLNYERELRRTDKWLFSGGVGMSMNVILSSSFKLGGNWTKEDLERKLIDFRAALQQEGKASPAGRASSSHEIVSPAAGYLQGGSLLANSSFYLSGNVRIERVVNERWSLYFAPTVSRLIAFRPGDGGKGPLEDRIHNTMLRFGTRILLADK